MVMRYARGAPGPGGSAVAVSAPLRAPWRGSGALGLLRRRRAFLAAALPLAVLPRLRARALRPKAVPAFGRPLGRARIDDAGKPRGASRPRAALSARRRASAACPRGGRKSGDPAPQGGRRRRFGTLRAPHAFFGFAAAKGGDSCASVRCFFPRLPSTRRKLARGARGAQSAPKASKQGVLICAFHFCTTAAAQPIFTLTRHSCSRGGIGKTCIILPNSLDIEKNGVFARPHCFSASPAKSLFCRCRWDVPPFR